MTGERLVHADVVVLVHPSDTRIHSRARCAEPTLGPYEADVLLDFVRRGGGRKVRHDVASEYILRELKTPTESADVH